MSLNLWTEERNEQFSLGCLIKVNLKIGNRDGDVYAVKATNGKCYLVVEANTSHNAEEFHGMGSTEQMEILEATFAALVKEVTIERI